jgi:hypothetical protein
MLKLCRLNIFSIITNKANENIFHPFVGQIEKHDFFAFISTNFASAWKNKFTVINQRTGGRGGKEIFTIGFQSIRGMISIFLLLILSFSSISHRFLN